MKVVKSYLSMKKSNVLKYKKSKFSGEFWKFFFQISKELTEPSFLSNFENTISLRKLRLHTFKKIEIFSYVDFASRIAKIWG